LALLGGLLHFLIILGVSSMYGFYLMKTEQVKNEIIELANMVNRREEQKIKN
jgi:hypothetical protein